MAPTLYIQGVQDVMLARAQQGILGTNHGPEGAMDKAPKLLIVAIQVVAVADFCQMEEARKSLVVAWEGEDLIMLEEINKMNAVLKQLAMVR